MFKRRLVAVAVAATAGGVAIASGEASARVPGLAWCQPSGCTLYNGAGSNPFFDVPGMTPVVEVCWKDAAGQRWFKVRTVYANGYMRASQVQNQYDVGRC